MDGTPRLLRRTISVWLSALMLTLSVAIPMLEQDEFVHEPKAESEHNPATCPTAHDHTICTQVSANLAAAAPGPAQRETHTVTRLAPPLPPASAVASALAEGHPTRAPPLA